MTRGQARRLILENAIGRLKKTSPWMPEVELKFIFRAALQDVGAEGLTGEDVSIIRMEVLSALRGMYGSRRHLEERRLGMEKCLVEGCDEDVVYCVQVVNGTHVNSCASCINAVIETAIDIQGIDSNKVAVILAPIVE